MATVAPPTATPIQQLDYSVNLLQALLWQYNTATNLQGLVQQKQTWYTTNQTQFWENWYTDVFDLNTANQFGLIVWSIILNFPLYVNTLPSSSSAPTFGFNNSFFTNFDQGNFQSTTGNSYQLPIATQRLALQLRYFQLCSSGTVPEINRFLNYVFNLYNGSVAGKVFLEDNYDMTQTYHFLFTIPNDLLYLFENYDILPRPAGVQNKIVDDTVNTWGFGPYQLNFNRGNFGG